MTAGLLTSRDSKNKLHKNCIADPSPFNITSYKNFRKVYQKTLRAAKKLYITSNLRNCNGNPRETWKVLNEAIGKSSEKGKITKINVNGTTCEDPADIANGFNDFFVHVGKEISDNVPIVSKLPEEYIQINPETVPLNLQNTTPDHVKKIVKSLAAKNSADSDGVSSKMIKLIINEIAIPLAHIFNLSLSSGTFPSCLKKSRVIPIFKSGSTLEFDNYRPISLLSSISKILEKIVSIKLISHLKSNNLLYTNQYGFLPGRSTEQNLIQVVNYITSALNENQYCIAVFIDLKKAFDVCSHEILLKKLSLMGITGNSLKWFESYLSNRTQCVDIDGTKSEEKSLLLSVIQGSILGPILFLCYINDFYICTTLFSTLFADDGTCLAKDKNLLILINYINTELQKIANWFLSNKMAVNTTKTKYIIFRTNGKPIDETVLNVVFNSSEIGKPNNPLQIFNIERIHNAGAIKNFKLLGLYLDEYLTFDAHINMLCSKVSKSLYIINRVKNFLPLDSLLSLYHALIHSHLSYCSSIFGCANQTSITKLFLKQKQAVRTITKSPFRANTAPIFKKLKILPLSKQIQYSQIKFMRDFHFNLTPISFTDMWVTNNSRNPNLQLRNGNDLHIPAHHYQSIKRLPKFQFPMVWNREDPSKLNENRIRYLRHLKNRLISDPT
jgi:hypothetical protein